MNKLILLGAAILCLLGSCHSSDSKHEEHDHAAETTAHDIHGEAAHESHAHGEIVLPPDRAQAAGVEVSTVQAETFHQVIRTGGQLLAAPGEESYLTAPVSGIVSLKQGIAEGTFFAKGATVATLSSRQMAEGDPVVKARIAYETARKEYERAQSLLPDRIISEKEFLRIKETYENARINYESLVGTATEEGETHPDGVRITAPIDGYIGTLSVANGQYIQAGQPIATLTRGNRLQLRADVSQRYAASLPHIHRAHFRTPYNNNVYDTESLNGGQPTVGRTAEQGSNYLPVTFHISGSKELIPGTYVEIYLLSEPIADAIALPREALTEEQGNFFVYLQEDEECYRKQPVTVGADDGQRIQILSGVHPGDRVVTRGAYQVKLAGATNAIPAHTHEH